MKSLELFEFVRELSLFFERKMPSDETLQQWLPELSHIPAEPLEWIGQQIKSGDNFPRNLPAAIRKGWSAWWEAHPEKRVKDRELGCEGCLHGYIQVSRFEPDLGRYYNTTFRCAHCKPRHPQSMTMATVEQLARQGYCKPVGYLTSWKYGDYLPDPEVKQRQTNPVDRGPVSGIVGQVAERFGA